jgi:hypothetical protein
MIFEVCDFITSRIKKVAELQLADNEFGEVKQYNSEFVLNLEISLGGASELHQSCCYL